MVEVGRWDSQVAQWWRICLQCRKRVFDSCVRKIPWRKKWQSTPVFLPEKSQGQRSLMGYSLRGCKRVGHIAMKQQTQWCDKWLHPWRLFPLLPAGCRNSRGVPSGTALSSLCWSLCSIFVSTLSPEALYWCPFLSWDFLDFLFYLFLVWTFILCF